MPEAIGSGYSNCIPADVELCTSVGPIDSLPQCVRYKRSTTAMHRKFLYLTTTNMAPATIEAYCRECRDYTTGSCKITKPENSNGNEGRPWYQCVRHKGFMRRGDSLGISPANPDCYCHKPSRAGHSAVRPTNYTCANNICCFFKPYGG